MAQDDEQTGSNRRCLVRRVIGKVPLAEINLGGYVVTGTLISPAVERM